MEIGAFLGLLCRHGRGYEFKFKCEAFILKIFATFAERCSIFQPFKNNSILKFITLNYIFLIHRVFLTCAFFSSIFSIFHYVPSKYIHRRVKNGEKIHFCDTWEILILPLSSIPLRFLILHAFIIHIIGDGNFHFLFSFHTQLFYIIIIFLAIVREKHE